MEVRAKTWKNGERTEWVSEGHDESADGNMQAGIVEAF